MSKEDLVRAPESAPTPSLRELAMVLFRQKKVFVSVSALVLMAAILYAFAGIKYEARMKVLVRRGRANAPVAAEENAPLDLTRMVMSEEDLNTEVELLRDEDVLRRVVEETGTGGRDWFHFLHLGEGKAERVERAARRLAKRLQVEPVKKTNLIEVRYAADDPEKAAKVLLSLRNAYLDKHMEVHRPSGEVGFFRQQMDESRRELEDSRQKLLRFGASRGIVAAAQQRDLALQKLSEMDAIFRQTRIEQSETRRRVFELETQLESLPERTTTQVRTADNPELLKALKSTLLDLQLKRTGLLTKFEPSHRLVQEVEQQIAQTESAIAAENMLPVKDETTDKNAQYEWAKSELQKAQVQSWALEARAAATISQAGAYQAVARQWGEDAITQDELISSEKAARDNYLLYVKKQEEARMDDALDERGIVNVAVAEHPMAPALPVWSLWTVLAMGFVAAGAAGTVAAFAADYLDPAFRTPEEVLAYLNSEVLASLPRLPKTRRLA